MTPVDSARVARVREASELSRRVLARVVRDNPNATLKELKAAARKAMPFKRSRKLYEEAAPWSVAALWEAQADREKAWLAETTAFFRERRLLGTPHPEQCRMSFASDDDRAAIRAEMAELAAMTEVF